MSMSNYDQVKSEYLRTSVMTASQEELYMMLYDGAVRFVEEAMAAMKEDKFEDAHNAIMRAQNIVLEFSSSLKPEVDPELCGKMASLYNFIYRRLVEGNLKHDVEILKDALKILEYQRETWVMLMKKIAEETKSASAASDDQNEPADPNQIPSLSISA